MPGPARADDFRVERGEDRLAEVRQRKEIAQLAQPAVRRDGEPNAAYENQ